VCGYWLDNLTAITGKGTDFVQTLNGSKKQTRSEASPRQKMFGAILHFLLRLHDKFN